ncbi:MAG: MBL fold metallo-hydrolase, partial [Deltaproteobacteria bacterium]|nr:MBL fold metallo-hydrolase [Deltaproteobacteria bacterium]
MTVHQSLNRRWVTVVASSTFLWVGCKAAEPPPPPVPDDSEATGYTIAVNQKFAEMLDLDDQEDFEQASKGLIAAAPMEPVKDSAGKVIFDPSQYDFIKGDAPATVNPSLWRQAKLNMHRGLYKVTDGIYQLRGFDLANMSIIEGDTGWIIVDPLTNKSTSAQALAFAREHLGNKPITAIIFTHSHVDHFGGALGLMSMEEAAAKNVQIIAPIGFIKEATSENIVAGPAMLRRSEFMYAIRVPRGPTGHVSTGLGIQPVVGEASIMVPTTVIKEPREDATIDGVQFRFLNAPGSEAPAELVFYLPEHKAFCGAEVLSRNMHNLYTLRGTKVRDAVKWSDYIDDSINDFGEAELYFASHHWPIWGQERVIEFLEKQRDMYRFINDQTLRWSNAGLTPREIAERIEMPESLATEFYNRDYYGTLRHNSKAVYQRYFGWYSGNPADLNPLPPSEAASRYVDYMGGAQAVIDKAQKSFDEGEYRWVAQVLDHVIFAQPDNQAAKELLAEAYRQLAYQSESGPWRDVYLTGAYELQFGPPDEGIKLSDAMEMLEQTPVIEFLTAMSVRLKAEKAHGKEMTINIVLTDLDQSYVLELKNSVLHYRESEPDPEANATLKITHPMFLKMMVGEAKLTDMVFSKELSIKGSKLDLVRFFALMDKPDSTFPIVT